MVVGAFRGCAVITWGGARSHASQLIRSVWLSGGWEEEGRRPAAWPGLPRAPVQSALLVSSGDTLQIAESLHGTLLAIVIN